jgi:uncharacterized protein YerC
MTHISRKKLPTKILDQILDSLILVITETKHKEETVELLNALLSNTERIMLAKRIATVYLLNEGVDGTVIAETLGVTPYTVSRLKLWFETKGGGYRIAVNELKRQKQLEALKLLALKLAAYAVRSARLG